jgi:cytochrome c-type biogenesis protein CcmH/NrfG
LPVSRPDLPVSHTRDLITGLAVAAGLVALVFLTSSSIDQTVTATGTWSEIAVTWFGAVACAAVVLIGGRGRAWGAPAVALFAAFTALAALSILWSVQPDWSWFGANQLLSYLSVFAGAVALGRLVPGRWPALVGGVATTMAVLCAYSLLVKVFPATLASTNQYGRLQAPFGYWNAVGLSGALGLVPALWVGTRRSGSPLLRGLAVPAMTLMISVLVLSYSRSALLVAVLGVAAWTALVPLRLRSALVLALAGLGALPIVVVALHSRGVSSDGVGLAAQDAAGHSFGPVLLGMVIVAGVAGVAVAAATDRVTVAETLRRRIGTVLVIGVALMPFVAVAALAASSRGLFGEISHAWQSLTSSHSVVFNNSSRLTELGSSRPVYWHEGLSVGSHALLKGAGELGYGVARLRYTTDTAKADQAHSYPVQTFADLGLIGLVLTVALLVAWCRAAARPLAIRAPWRLLSSEQSLERAGMLALVIVVVVFGIHSCLDFTFYFPGVTIPALLCAGWLAGRGPLAAPIGRRAGAHVSVRQRPAAGALVTGLVALALIGAWVMWQPLRSAQALADAENHPESAFASAQAAASRDPLSIEPLYLLSVLNQDTKNVAAARVQLVKATEVQPDNPQSWAWLGVLDFGRGRPREAIADMQRVLALDHPANDPNRLLANGIIDQATALLEQRQAAAARVSSPKRPPDRPPRRRKTDRTSALRSG